MTTTAKTMTEEQARVWEGLTAEERVEAVLGGMRDAFEDFSPDFATWAMFYGPAGGERENPFV